jgi:hypothetical protein
MRRTADRSATPIRSHLRRAALAFVAGALLAALAATSAVSSPERPCKLPGFSSVKFVYAVTGTPPHVLLHVRNARVICGGPDDGHWDPIGPMHTVGLADPVTISLIGPSSTTARPATLAQLRQLTRLQTRDRRFGWFGGAYGVRTGAAGQVDSLTELFHP